jgi:hypothetical protein
MPVNGREVARHHAKILHYDAMLLDMTETPTLDFTARSVPMHCGMR